jgi:hypothetical protein
VDECKPLVAVLRANLPEVVSANPLVVKLLLMAQRPAEGATVGRCRLTLSNTR